MKSNTPEKNIRDATRSALFTRGYFGESESHRDDSQMARWNRVTAVSQALFSVLPPICGSTFLVRHALTVRPAPGTNEPLTHVDCVAVTHFGVFAVSGFNWSGTIAPRFNDPTITASGPDGAVSVFPCPLQQLDPAVAFLGALLEEYRCPVEGVALSTRTDCIIHPSTPPSILKSEELYHYFRSKLHRYIDTRPYFLDFDDVARRLHSII